MLQPCTLQLQGVALTCKRIIQACKRVAQACRSRRWLSGRAYTSRHESVERLWVRFFKWWMDYFGVVLASNGLLPKSKLWLGLIIVFLQYYNTIVAQSCSRRDTLLTLEAWCSMMASCSDLDRSNCSKPRARQISLHSWEWKNSAIPFVPRLPSPYISPVH